jgi:hypothetical protein
MKIKVYEGKWLHLTDIAMMFNELYGSNYSYTYIRRVANDFPGVEIGFGGTSKTDLYLTVNDTIRITAKMTKIKDDSWLDHLEY